MRMLGYRRIFPPNQRAKLGSKSKGDTMGRRQNIVNGNVGHNQGFDVHSKYNTWQKFNIRTY